EASLHLVYKEDEYNYNFYMMYNNHRYDLDDANGEAKQDTWKLIVLRGRGRLVVLGDRSSSESNSVCEEVGGVEKMSSTGSKLMVRGDECLEGYVHVSGGELSECRDDFGVSKSLLGEILRIMIGEGGGETFGHDGGAI
nr:hypothetical protein [Tanacetum cinerariifolium]